MNETNLLSVANLLCTFALAGLTAVYVWLTNRLLRAQTDPCVVVYAQHDDSRSTIVILKIENVGRGMARNVRFEFSEPLPERAFGINPEEARTPPAMSVGPLISGIPALAPGEVRRITWGQYGGLKKAIGDRSVKVTCTYNRMLVPYDLIEQDIQTDSYLDIRSFEGTDATDPDGARQSAQELREIKKLLERLLTRLTESDQ